VTAKSVLVRLQSLRTRARAPTCPFATPLILSQTNAVGSRQRPFCFRERLFLRQRRGPNLAKTFFYFFFLLENAYFWDKNAVQSEENLFLCIENAYFWDKNAVQIR